MQGTSADQWIVPLIQGYIEVRQVPVLTGQTLPDVLQGRYRSEGRMKRKDSDLDLKVKQGSESTTADGRPDSAMIEMTEMTTKPDAEDEEEESLKGTV